MNKIVVYLQARRYYGTLPIEIEEIDSKKELDSFMQRLEFGEDEQFTNAVDATFCKYDPRQHSYSFDHERIYNVDEDGLYTNWRQIFYEKLLSHLSEEDKEIE